MEQFINEIWKPIQENPIYLVSNYGRIRSLDKTIFSSHNNGYITRKGKILKLNNSNAKKYWRVGIKIKGKQRHCSIHRLVAQAFIPNPNNLPQVNHIDGNKDNNHVSNLEWCTNSYNMQHAIAMGLNQTEKHRKNASLQCNFRKLTVEQVIFIKTEWSKITTEDLKIKGTIMNFCRKMQKLFNLNSANTIFWIIKKGKATNTFINQDIVQTTNFKDNIAL